MKRITLAAVLLVTALLVGSPAPGDHHERLWISCRATTVESNGDFYCDARTLVAGGLLSDGVTLQLWTMSTDPKESDDLLVVCTQKYAQAKCGELPHLLRSGDLITWVPKFVVSEDNRLVTRNRWPVTINGGLVE